MKQHNKLKILNDPIYGFITIPNQDVYEIIEHPYFQRLRRITQMGLSYLVYPGAHHTRFHHALGCMFLMQKAIRILRFKGVLITKEEESGLLTAILLHDIGHGPFSHAMEHSLVNGVSHEEVSLLFMEQLNVEFNGRLSLAIKIFKGDYSRKFLNDLISSQLDMDRADYLKRDSFYTGVAEGNINSERLITMLNVVNDELVIEEKGIYSVEKFLTARRLMYWQVYLHKTSLVAEQLLIRLLMRAKELTSNGIHLEGCRNLNYFLQNNVSKSTLDFEALETFAKLDDVDIVSAMKTWRDHDDFVLSNLSQMILERELLKIKFHKKKVKASNLQKHITRLKIKYNINDVEASYFVFNGEVMNQAYELKKDNIKILLKNGRVQDIVNISDHLNLKALSKLVTKYYICYPKDEL